ncbi:hypothetical protein ABZP36_024881 [Zizania latifolia]
MEARKWVEERDLLLLEADSKGDNDDVDDDDKSTQFDLDSEDDSATFEAPFLNKFGPIRGSSRNALSKLAEGNDDEDDNSEFRKDDGGCISPTTTWTPSTPNLSISLNGLSFSGSSKCHSDVAKNRVTTKTNINYSGSHSENKYGGWSANEMLPPSSSFLKLLDLSANEWSAFPEKF